MSCIQVENIRSILEQKQSDIAKRDHEYAKKFNSDKLFLNGENKKQMELGCEILSEKLKNITSVDIDYKWNGFIKGKFFTQEEYEKIDNVLYFYTGCSAMKDFVKSFNKIDKNVSLHVEQPFVNRISLNESKLKENKLQYELKFDQEYKDVYHSGFRHSYHDKVPVHPSPDNVFFGFN